MTQRAIYRNECMHIFGPKQVHRGLMTSSLRLLYVNKATRMTRKQFWEMHNRGAPRVADPVHF